MFQSADENEYNNNYIYYISIIVASPDYECPTCNYKCSATSVKDSKNHI